MSLPDNPLSQETAFSSTKSDVKPQERPTVAVSGVETYNPLPPDAPTETYAAYRWYLEQATLLVNTFKWAVLGTAVGILAGLGVRLYLYILNHAIGFGHALDRFGIPHFWLLPLILPLCVLLAHITTRQKAHDDLESQEGTDAVIEAIHTRSGRLDPFAIPVRLFLSILTLFGGGSVGKEGPAAQIGAMFSSLLSDLLRLSDEDRRRLVICGVSAGFAAVFGTPISGALFGVEVLYLGRLEYPVLFPCIVAGIVGHLACGASPPVPVLVPGNGHAHQLSQPMLVLLSLLSGVFFGLVAMLLIETMRFLDQQLRRFASHPFWVAVFGGTALAVLYQLAGSGYADLSEPLIRSALEGTARIMLLAFLVKIIATSLSLKTGGAGGIVTPLFFIGSTAGAAMAQILHLPVPLFARFGFVAVLAAAANTPIAASVMALELLGGHFGVEAALCACTAFLIVGHRSVFSSQYLGYSKAAGLLPTLDVPIGKIVPSDIQLHENSFIKRLERALQKRHRKEDN
ncbi:chloride channel protein EriC [Chthonomonas calidirosea]|nr:chloride channel protein EriC [Chthonomonas calidirosea]